MIGRTPATITASRPLRHGVIADLEVTEEMLRQFIGRVHRGRMTHPRVVMCVPSGLTGVELERRAGGLPVGGRAGGAPDRRADRRGRRRGARHLRARPAGWSSTSAAERARWRSISMGAMVVQRSLRIAGIRLRRRAGQLAAPPSRADHRTADRGGAEGRDRLRGPAGARSRRGKSAGATPSRGSRERSQISSEEVREALGEAVQAIVDAVRDALEQTPPELAGDVADTGILLAGGSSLLAGLPRAADTSRPGSPRGWRTRR